MPATAACSMHLPACPPPVSSVMAARRLPSFEGLLRAGLGRGPPSAKPTWFPPRMVQARAAAGAATGLGPFL
eukprot:8355408-Alexandrium_andersonii.AAC.1